MAAIANTHAKAAANPKAQRPSYAAGPVSAPLVVNAAKPYSFAYEVVDPAGIFFWNWFLLFYPLDSRNTKKPKTVEFL